MMDETTRLAEIAERHEKATKGEWDYDGEIVWINVPEGDPEHHTGNFDIYAPGAADDQYPEEPIIIGNINGQIAAGRANAEFLAHAHQDTPYLLAQLTAAQARSREDAEIMTQMSDDITSLVWHVKFLCRLYNDGDLPIGFDSIDARHTARQVARADELEGRTDG